MASNKRRNNPRLTILSAGGFEYLSSPVAIVDAAWAMVSFPSKGDIQGASGSFYYCCNATYSCLNNTKVAEKHRLHANKTCAAPHHCRNSMSVILIVRFSARTFQ